MFPLIHKPRHTTHPNDFNGEWKVLSPLSLPYVNHRCCTLAICGALLKVKALKPLKRSNFQHQATIYITSIYVFQSKLNGTVTNITKRKFFGLSSCKLLSHAARIYVVGQMAQSGPTVIFKFMQM